MRAPSVRLAIGTGAMLCAAAAMTLTAAGPANAGTPPSVNGKKYSDAQTALSGAGFTPVVSTTVGDKLAWSDCLVTNVVTRTQPAVENSSGSSVNQALVSLNCYGTEASSKGAGYSAGSPEGASLAAVASSSAAAASSSAAAAKSAG
ncbi:MULTISPECIES: hypothetical protein [unclassified Mycobacterium]|uniref:hypothetical protein n=1 Tax=unclassified Mycobacterium TaxID=2642494 RepID=UPI0029C908A7|nr:MULTISPECIES: hypothetical protein [unclassified Mycobacterium]